MDAALDGYGADDTFREYLARTEPAYRVIRHVGALGWLVEHDIDATPTVVELERIAAASD